MSQTWNKVLNLHKTNQIKEEINKIIKDLKGLEKNINEVQQDLLDPNYVSSKFIELEDKSRQNNVRIDGIDE